MRLGTNPINKLRPATVHLLNQIHNCFQLRVCTVQVKVVDVQLGVGVCCASSLESDSDELLAEDVEKDRGAEGAVFVEDLVDDVPGTNLAFVPSGNFRDVSLDD